jgi:hypothetical protein
MLVTAQRASDVRLDQVTHDVQLLAVDEGDDGRSGPARGERVTGSR